MIGIDTSILVRLSLNDDPAKNKHIDALLAAHGAMPSSLLVTDVVLVEAVWTLKSFGAGSNGFADCLVVAKHARHGCDFTATFDKGMRKLPRVKVI